MERERGRLATGWAILLVVSAGFGVVACGAGGRTSSTTTTTAASTATTAAASATSAPSAPTTAGTTTTTVDATEKAAAASAIASANLSDAATLDALDAVRFTDAGAVAAAEALAAGAAGDARWAAAWIYATGGVDPAPLLPLLSSDDGTVQAIAASALIARGVKDGAAPLGALASSTAAMRGASPPLSIGDYVVSSLARYVDGPDVPAAATLADAAAAWAAWLSAHASAMTFDESTGRWAA